MSEKDTTTCEDGGMLVSRNLDNDLARAEVACLYAHLARCAGCRAKAAEMARIESASVELAKAYEIHSVGSGFASAIQKKITPRRNALPGLSSPFANIRALFASRGFAALAGAALGLVLVIAFFRPDNGPVRPDLARFVLHPISFQSSSDSLEWHHDEELAPGSSVLITVQKGHEDSYHLKIESSGPAELEISHEADGEEKSVHKAAFNGIRYGSLHGPRPGDVIVIKNTGSTAVRIKAHTVERGSVTVSKKRHSEA